MRLPNVHPPNDACLGETMYIREPPFMAISLIGVYLGLYLCTWSLYVAMTTFSWWPSYKTCLFGVFNVPLVASCLLKNAYETLARVASASSFSVSLHGRSTVSHA